ncbi:hypothetical protein [Mesorhizobium amorphae]|uniref:hypothetical protein n=1 Tax=Mesorhizobium amorphae TaxID=71433 RepID=UPI0011840CD1|nr:hypothetical protein [Mesorhizobium amorphae]
MASDQEKYEREERAKRLKSAREAAGFSGPKAVVAASSGQINENAYKAHEQGRNGFTVSDGRTYADLFGVSLIWLYLGVGSANDEHAKTSAGKVSGENTIKDMLRQIDKLPEEAIGPIWRLIRGYLEDAGQLGPDLPRDQPEPANPRRVEEPSR